MIALDLRVIAHALCGKVAGRNCVVAPGPGHSPGDRSLSIRIDAGAPDGFIVNSFAGDDWVACRDYVRQRLGLPEWQPGDGQGRRVHSSHRREFDRMAIDREAEPRPRTDEDRERIARAVELWNKGRDPRGTVAEQYLKARALDLPGELAGHVLRFHPRCPWRNECTGEVERIPAMLAAFRSVHDDTLTGVHRIRLDRPQLWPKTERRMLGITSQSAIKLGAINARKLLIAEGVESAMAALQLGYSPAWALGSAGAISFFPIIDSVKTLIINREPDKASHDAVQNCGRRWSRAHRRVEILISEVGDLNDEVMQRKAHG